MFLLSVVITYITKVVKIGGHRVCVGGGSPIEEIHDGGNQNWGQKVCVGGGGCQ